ncbi:MAG: TMEM165/GDT1 family protein [Desulfobacterota bacterium]|nr:TMEM165/GDT1 family protein [Thermodesulfobacteriota bacterium]
MTAFIAALIFVVLAEMGDKTQLLGMAFATRFRWQTVMWGVFVATAANHLLAAAAGSYLTLIVPLGIIKVAAAVSFIGFGLWTIRGDQLSGEDQRYQFSPFWTVTIAFFMAEMGDKTQLATISLAVEYNSVINVWMGTTLGMMISNAFGIIVGIVMGKKIPERAIKWGSALIFIAFGAVGLYENLPEPLLTPLALTVGGLALLLLVGLVAWRNNKKTVLAPVREKQDSLDRNRMKM